MDTIRLHLYGCYTNAVDGLEFTREELEHAFETNAKKAHRAIGVYFSTC
jgi:hypothetical protein